MPSTTGPIQRVRPAAVQARTVSTQARTMLAQTPMKPTTTGGLSARVPPPDTVTLSTQSASSCCCAVCGGLECLDRTRFFSGQLLTEADLNNEQSYLLAKNRLHNRYLHGWGVVCGLEVTCGDCAGWVNISAGYALDPCGNDIIVCQPQSFNVIQAIQACCTPKSSTANCSPLRYSPPANCQDIEQTWCITIQYKEQASQMVTPLKSSANGSSSSNSGCTCGCGSSQASTGCGCGSSNSSSSSSTSTSTTAASCEATRIIEGFEFGVCQSPEEERLSPALNNARGSDARYQQLQSLVLQQPTLKDASNNDLSDQAAYQAASIYTNSVVTALGSAFDTDCGIRSSLDGINIAKPTGTEGYVANLRINLSSITDTIRGAALKRFCSVLLPPCPTPPCDKRLILACVTIRRGEIINICHFGGGRQQVVTFPVLGYWLTALSGESWSTELGDILGKLCCGDSELRDSLLMADTTKRDLYTTGSSAMPAALNQALISTLAQKLGAGLMNTISPTYNAVDLRPLVGLDTDKTLVLLDGYKISRDNLTQTDVSTDPTWTDSAVAAAASYTPSNFIPTQPLTMYTRNKLTVGFAVTNPTDVLSAQIASLQSQVNTLSSQLNNMQPPANPTGANTTQP